MKPVLLEYLRCIKSGGPLDVVIIEETPVVLTDEEKRMIRRAGRSSVASYETEIITGVLFCRVSGARYPIVKGVPRIYRDAEKDFSIPGQHLNTQMLPINKHERQVQTSFSDEWDEFNYNDGTIWLWTVDDRLDTFCEELRIDSPEEIRGRLMVECGCGPAVMSLALTQRFGVEIIAMDMSYVIGSAFKASKSNLLHLIQTSVLNPPLASSIADITHSHGVLHHTYSTKAAFDAIARLTKPSGTLYVWLYGKKKGWNRFRFLFIRSSRFVVARLPRPVQTLALWVLAGITAGVRFIKRIVGLQKVEYKTLSQFMVGIRDKYTPLYAREHTEREVLGWFAEAGYVSANRRVQWQKTVMWRGSTDLSIIGKRKEKPLKLQVLVGSNARPE